MRHQNSLLQLVGVASVFVSHEGRGVQQATFRKRFAIGLKLDNRIKATCFGVQPRFNLAWLLHRCG